MSKNAFGHVGAHALAKGLKENSMLTLLDLYDNAVRNDGADALAKGLRKFNIGIPELVFEHSWRRGC